MLQGKNDEKRKNTKKCFLGSKAIVLLYIKADIMAYKNEKERKAFSPRNPRKTSYGKAPL